MRQIITILFLSILIAGCDYFQKQTINITPTHVVSVIDRIKLEELMITIQDLPSSISWGTTGARQVVVERAGLKGENAVNTLFYPSSNDFLGPNQLILRFSSNTLAEEYYSKPVATDVNGYTPPEWKFESSLADQARITCDNDFGTNINGPMTCIWNARYGRIVVFYQAFLYSDVFTIESVQKTVERIDAKVTQALRNIE